MRPDARHRWILVLLLPLTVGAGFGASSYERTQLEQLAVKAGGAMSEERSQAIQIGSLTAGLALGLAVFAVLLGLYTVLQRTPTAGKVVAKAISVVACLVLVAAAGAMWVYLLPHFEQLVQRR